MDNVKKPTKAGILCAMDRETFHSFTKNAWIGNLGASCHITYDDIGLYGITNINKFVQGNLGIGKKGKLQVKCVKLMEANNNTYYGL